MTNQAQEKIEAGIIPQAREVFGRRYQKFIALVEELKATNEVKRQVEEASKRLNQELQSMWADCEAKTVLEDHTRITLVSSSNSHISKEKLIEAGVTATVIQSCTVVREYQFVKVTEAK